MEYQTISSLEPGPEKEHLVLMKPAAPTSYLGVARDKSIPPAVIGGGWYSKFYQNGVESNRMVVLHLHGGAYVLRGVRSKEWGWGLETLPKPSMDTSSIHSTASPPTLKDDSQLLFKTALPSTSIC